MAKIRVVNYTFNAAGKTITFTDYGSILLDAIYAVVNSTTQQIIYNPSNTSLGGTVSTNVLTLEGDTTGMNNTDKLLILYDDADAHVGRVSPAADVVDVTLSLDTSSYASGDVLADSQEITGFFRVAGGTATIVSVAANDKDDQGQPFDLFFLRSNVSLGAENAAPSITDANADEILGVVSSGAWLDLGGNRHSSFFISPIKVKAAGGSTSIWVAAITRGAPTHTASGITLKIGVEKD